MRNVPKLTLLCAVVSLAGCAETADDRTVDRSLGDRKPLSDLRAGIWVDPNGCDQWIIDDGTEGYLSARLDKYGKPVCSGVAPPNTATGPYRAGL